jgi:hypothetical protein
MWFVSLFNDGAAAAAGGGGTFSLLEANKCFPIINVMITRIRFNTSERDLIFHFPVTA